MGSENGSTGARVTLSGKRALFEQLLADGVTAIFGNPGTTEQGFMDLLPEYPQIRYYLALHEGVAVTMADVYARASGRPGFVELHTAPGVGNGMGMLFNAWAGGSPLVVYAGQSVAEGLFQEPYLSADVVSMAKPITKWAAEITQTSDVPQALRRAFKVAMEPPRGPVLLSIPIDVLDGKAEVVIEPTTQVAWKTRPPLSAVEEAVALIRAASAPAIAVGDNVHLTGAQDAVVRLAELLGAPILNAFSNGVNAPAGHPLYVPRSIPVSAEEVRTALEGFDLILVVGSSLFPSIFPDRKGPVPDGVRVIQADFNSWELGKNHPGDVLMRADPGETLLAVIEEIDRTAGTDELAAWRVRRAAMEGRIAAQREAARARHRAGWDSVPISPHRVMAEIAAALPPDAAVFDEAISSGASLETYLQPAEPWRRFRARGGGIGQGLPGALGLKVAYPDRPVVGIASDGSSMYSITALWTAAHHRIPVTFVMCNNASYRLLKLNLQKYRSAGEAGRPFAHLDLSDPELRFDRIAEALGIRGRRIERPDEIGPALREAIASGEPRMLDVILDGSV